MNARQDYLNKVNMKQENMIFSIDNEKVPKGFLAEDNVCQTNLFLWRILGYPTLRPL